MGAEKRSTLNVLFIIKKSELLKHEKEETEKVAETEKVIQCVTNEK